VTACRCIHSQGFPIHSDRSIILVVLPLCSRLESEGFPSSQRGFIRIMITSRSSFTVESPASTVKWSTVRDTDTHAFAIPH